MPDELTTTIDYPAIDFPDAIEPDEPAPVAAAAVAEPFHDRVRRGVRHPHNWLQLVRFGAVGASGYVVNLVIFAACVHLLKVDFRVASPIAYLVSVVTNFWLNRHWTFKAKAVHPGRQASKFFAVSLAAYGISYVVLLLLVNSAGMDKVVAQAIAVIAGMPLQFIGQKLWSFKA